MWLPQSNLIMDTFKIRKQLALSETKIDDAIESACKSFLLLDRPPTTGLTPLRENELLQKLND
jgi:hypothetical protein